MEAKPSKPDASTAVRCQTDWLIQAGVVLKCHRVEHAYNPIAAFEDLSAFKIYYNDVGLLGMRANLPQQTILSSDDSMFMGAVTENYVAQALTANSHPLYYWTSKHSAELDFVMQNGTDIVGVEVKKGLHTKSKSMHQFLSRYSTAHAIRFSEKNFGKTADTLSLPLYAAFCV